MLYLLLLFSRAMFICRLPRQRQLLPRYYYAIFDAAIIARFHDDGAAMPLRRRQCCCRFDIIFTLRCALSRMLLCC